MQRAQGSPTASAQPAADTRQRTVRLPFGLPAVPAARAQVVEDLVAQQVPQQVVDESESVVAELVANAVRHAAPLPDGSVRVRWQSRAGVVEVEVTDGGGRTRPAARPPAHFAASGRGLRIVRGLAHEWGVIDAPRRWSAGPVERTVWASVGGPSRRRAW